MKPLFDRPAEANATVIAHAALLERTSQYSVASSSVLPVLLPVAMAVADSVAASAALSIARHAAGKYALGAAVNTVGMYSAPLILNGGAAATQWALLALPSGRQCQGLV